MNIPTKRGLKIAKIRLGCCGSSDRLWPLDPPEAASIPSVLSEDRRAVVISSETGSGALLFQDASRSFEYHVQTKYV